MICHQCYRDISEDMMMKNLVGKIMNECRTCYNYIGKGDGYGSEDEEEINKWFEGSNKRKEQLIKEGKL